MVSFWAVTGVSIKTVDYIALLIKWFELGSFYQFSRHVGKKGDYFVSLIYSPC
jgi:hypothetical protein